jgi:hypothetical protein
MRHRFLSLLLILPQTTQDLQSLLHSQSGRAACVSAH